MNKIVSVFILLFSLLTITAQEEDVLLTLALDSVFSKVKDTEPGGSVYIQKGNQSLYSRNFGLANLKTKEKFTENTVSNITSVTKTFIAYGILILQKQGKLLLDDSLVTYFPNMKNTATAGKIKIKHLLSHSSGLPVIATKTNDTLVFIDRPDFEPGSNYRYSGVDYNILCLIIEKITGEKWQAFIQKYIFEPTGMISSKIVNGNYKDKQRTQGYKKLKGKYTAYNTQSCDEKYPLCNSIWTSPGNLRKYVYAIKECVFLDCETAKSATQIYKHDNWRSMRNPTNGFSWTIHEEPNKDTYVECAGSGSGLATQIILHPKQDIIIIWVSNNDVSYSNLLLQKLRQRAYVK
ncbi:MAG: serine hydrolase domain-containing protein [Bacteroidota bacterium]|nr:serine hydrolase domain-containing protein [Bacteroidota bacterium]